MALLRSRRLGEAGFAHAFPERETPDGELLTALGAGAIVQVKQVHGAGVVLAGEAQGREADALVARGGGPAVAVGVRVADCVPVLVGDPETGDVAAIHAGWRGVVAGVVGAALACLGPRRPGRVAAIGPCIGPCCFEVGRDVGERIGFVVREQGDKAFVDLRAAVRAQLADAGVELVDEVPGCTRHEPRFHSFRRDGAHSGRMLASIATRVPAGPRTPALAT